MPHSNHGHSNGLDTYDTKASTIPAGKEVTGSFLSLSIP